MVVKSFHDVFDDIQQLYSFSSSSVLQRRPRSVSEWKRLTSCHPESSPGDQFCFCVFVALELKKKKMTFLQICRVFQIFTRKVIINRRESVTKLKRRKGINRLSVDHPKAE